MEAMTKALKDFWARIKDWAGQIEDSVYYERLISKYDSLEPSQAQKGARVLLGVFVFFALCFYFYPLWHVVSLKWELGSYRHMLADMEGFNSNYKPQAKKTYTPPMGWQNLPADTQDEFLTSVDQYLAQIGVIPEFTKIETQGNETSISFQEISIKQAVSFLFQIEGWYPSVKLIRNQIGVHPRSKELLTMQVGFRFDGPGASAVTAGGNSDSGIGDEPGFDSPQVNPNSGNQASGGAPFSNNQGTESFGQDGDEFDVPPPPPPPPVMDDFGQDMPPPLEEDL